MTSSHTDEMFAAIGGVAVTPSDTSNLEPMSRSLWIGGNGDVAVETADGSEITFTGAVAGTVIPAQCMKVKATGTTATNILALY